MLSWWSWATSVQPAYVLAYANSSDKHTSKTQN